LVLLSHDRRRVVHTAVTAHPTAAWTAQQFRDAFPWDQAPRYLTRDRDLAFQAVTATAKAMGFEQVLTAPRSPLAECLRRAVHRLCAPRVPRSRGRLDGGRSAQNPQIVRGVLHDNAHASVARERLTRTTTGDATTPRASGSHSRGGRTPPPVRTSRRVAFGLRRHHLVLRRF
jgi:hypothetical protein